MILSEWHQRFLQQARWTYAARSFCRSQINLPPTAYILEVGCGSGAVLSEFDESYTAFGIDIDLPSLDYAKSISKNFLLTTADGYQLPFPPGTFDLVFCHYLLLWLSDPFTLIREMQRVTRHGGWLCLFAEPDYAARLDFPSPLDQLGQAQNQSLQDQGVCLTTGRSLTSWLSQVGLESVQSGILGGHWSNTLNDHTWLLEWQTIAHDLETQLDPQTLQNYRDLDQQAYQQGQRVLFIPTFYAWGMKK